MKKILIPALVAFTAIQTQAATIFADNFDGGAVALNGTTPDTTTGGETWVAAPQFLANGSAGAWGIIGSSNGSSATLDFNPSAGTEYTLDARVDITVSDDWIAFGFASGNSTSLSPNSRFVNGSTPLGRVWMLMNGTGVANTWQDGTSVNQGADNNVNSAGFIDMRIVLDTTAATWTSTWYAKEAASSSYTLVHATQDVVSQALIDSVGFAGSGGTEGTIQSFSLTQIPEPSAPVLISLAGLGLMARRRR